MSRDAELEFPQAQHQPQPHVASNPNFFVNGNGEEQDLEPREDSAGSMITRCV